MAARGKHGFWGRPGKARGLDAGGRRDARTRHGWLSQASVGGNERSLIPAWRRAAQGERATLLSGAGGRRINGWPVFTRDAGGNGCKGRHPILTLGCTRALYALEHYRGVDENEGDEGGGGWGDVDSEDVEQHCGAFLAAHLVLGVVPTHTHTVTRAVQGWRQRRDGWWQE